MARTVIPTNFQDDALAEEMQGRRRYRQILNADGTVSFEDVTDYDTEGSTFGASRVNEMAQNINESADVNKIIDDLEDISVVTQDGYIAGAKSVKALNINLNGFRFREVDDSAQYSTDNGGTWKNFSSAPTLLGAYSGNQTIDVSNIPNYQNKTFFMADITYNNPIPSYCTNVQSCNDFAPTLTINGSNLVVSGVNVTMTYTKTNSTTAYAYGNASYNIYYV